MISFSFRRGLAPLALALPAFAGPLAAQAPLALQGPRAAVPRPAFRAALVTGDLLDGILVQSIQNIHVDDDGNWIVHAQIAHPDLGQDQVVVLNGEVIHQENHPTSAPPGTAFGIFDAVQVAGGGTSAINCQLYDGGTSPLLDAVYVGDAPIILEGAVAAAPQLPNGSTYGGIFDIKMNEAGAVLVNGFLRPPLPPFTGYAALLRVDPPANTLQLIVQKGSVLPENPSWSVFRILSDPQNTALNRLGQALFLVTFDDPLNTEAIYLGDEGGALRIAQEGLPSPVQGDPYLHFNVQGLDLNDAGDVVFQTTLASGRRIVVRNGQLFLGIGDPMPGFPGLTLLGLPTWGPIEIDNGGRVLWAPTYGAAPFNVHNGLFLDFVQLLEFGKSRFIDGYRQDQLVNFHVSPNGRWIIFESKIPGGEGAFLVELG